jgi:hypothetical protein
MQIIVDRLKRAADTISGQPATANIELGCRIYRGAATTSAGALPNEERRRNTR